MKKEDLKLTWAPGVSAFMADNEGITALDLSVGITTKENDYWETEIKAPKDWSAKTLMTSLAYACVSAGIVPKVIHVISATKTIIN